MPPSSEPAANQLPAVRDSAAPMFGIVLGIVVMTVLALNALAY
jgi:hypothetical protein